MLQKQVAGLYVIKINNEQLYYMRSIRFRKPNLLLDRYENNVKTMLDGYKKQHRKKIEVAKTSAMETFIAQPKNWLGAIWKLNIIYQLIDANVTKNIRIPIIVHIEVHVTAHPKIEISQ